MLADPCSWVDKAEDVKAYLNLITNSTLSLLPCVQSTVGQLKEQLVSLSGIPVDRQRLIFRGSVLQDAQLLTSQRKNPPHMLSVHYNSRVVC